MPCRTWGRTAVVIAVGAFVGAAPSSRAHAADAVRTDVAVVSGSAGLGLSVASLIYGTKVAIDLLQIRNGQRSPFDGSSVRYNAQVGTFTMGGLLLALGGVAVGLQASVAGGSCPGGSMCQVAYGFGATSLTVGVGMLVEGIVITTAPQTVRMRLPFLGRAGPARLQPILVPLAHGSAWGIGFGGPLL